MASSQAHWHWREQWWRLLIRWLTYVYGLSGSQSIVGDFLNLPISHWFGSWDIDYLTKVICLPFMSHLRILEIAINPGSAIMSDFAILSFLMRCLYASLTSPATLEHLKLNITFEGHYSLSQKVTKHHVILVMLCQVIHLNSRDRGPWGCRVCMTLPSSSFWSHHVRSIIMEWGGYLTISSLLWKEDVKFDREGKWEWPSRYTKATWQREPWIFSTSSRWQGQPLK